MSKRLWNSKGYHIGIYKGYKLFDIRLNKSFNVLNIEICYIWIAIVLPKWCQTKEYAYKDRIK
jgi:hypothetical protein